MTKTRILSLFLALSLLFSALALPCAAVNDTGSDSGAAQTDSSQGETAAEGAAPADEETPADPANGDSTPADTSDPAFSVDATAAMLVEMNSGTVVYEKNADDKVYPASLTKIMTCMLALELCKDLAEEVTVTESALAGLDPDGSTASLQVGEVLTMEDLLYCIMLPSANDACCVVAEHLGGTIDAFVEKMNEKAQALGCTGTHFANPDGLHDDDHYTTARDLRLITEAALQNETFRTIVSTAVYEVPATNLSDKRIVHTTNYLMSTAINPDYYYEKAKGVKTGYTSKAGRCLISTVKQGDVYYLSIVTGCKTIVNDDGSVVYDSFVQTKKLLEYGLTSFSFATVISQLVPVAQVKVKNANVDSVVVAPAQDVTALLPADYDESQLQLSYALTGGADTLSAPLETTDDVGTVTVTYQGKTVGQTTLRPITAVERHVVQYAAKSAGRQVKKYLWLLIPLALILAVVLLRVRSERIRRKKAAARRKKRAQQAGGHYLSQSGHARAAAKPQKTSSENTARNTPHHTPPKD